MLQRLIADFPGRDQGMFGRYNGLLRMTRMACVPDRESLQPQCQGLGLPIVTVPGKLDSGIDRCPGGGKSS